MSNINIKTLELENLIGKLEKDNQDIYDTIKSINVDIKSLDETKWKSKEKDILDEVLIPYITKIDNTILKYLNTPLNLLKEANEKYKLENEIIRKNTEVLSEDGFVNTIEDELL